MRSTLPLLFNPGNKIIGFNSWQLRYFRKEEIKRQDIEAKKKELRRRLNPAPIGVYSPIVKDAFDMMEKYMKGEKSLTDSSKTTQEEAK